MGTSVPNEFSSCEFILSQDRSSKHYNNSTFRKNFEHEITRGCGYMLTDVELSTRREGYCYSQKERFK